MYRALKIKKDDRQRARTIASNLNSAIKRKIALVDMLGLDITYKFFAKAGIRLDNVNCLHKIPFALEEFRISDLNYNGNNIYVITVFNENFIRIPRIHFNLNLVPNYYIITEVNKELDKGVVGGFITPKDVLKCPSDTNYYYPKITDLKDPESLIPFLTGKKATSLPFGRHNDAISLFCKVLDETISHQEKRRLLAHLLSCPVCLNKLLASSSFDDISKKMVLVKTDIEEKEEEQIIQDVSEDLPEKKIFSSDFNQKLDILNSTLPSAEKGFLNLKNLLENASKEIKEPIFNIEKIKSSMKKTIETFAKVIYLLKVFAIFALGILKRIPKKQAGIILASIVGVLLLANFISDIKNDKIKEKEPTVAQNSQYSYQTEEELPNVSPLFYAQSKQAYSRNTEVADISWDVDSSLAKKEEFINFLQILGRNIKLNLQNEFLLIEEIPQNNQLKFKISFSNNALVKNISIVNSSGNEVIDNKILDTLYETLSYVKAPRNGFMMPDIKLFLNVILD